MLQKLLQLEKKTKNIIAPMKTNLPASSREEFPRFSQACPCAFCSAKFLLCAPQGGEDPCAGPHSCLWSPPHRTSHRISLKCFLQGWPTHLKKNKIFSHHVLLDSKLGWECTEALKGKCGFFLDRKGLNSLLPNAEIIAFFFQMVSFLLPVGFFPSSKWFLLPIGLFSSNWFLFFFQLVSFLPVGLFSSNWFLFFFQLVSLAVTLIWYFGGHPPVQNCL